VRVKSKGFKACPGVLHGGDAVATPADVRGIVARARGDTGEGATAVAKGRLTRGERAA
jgi:hypothetical protein